MGRLKALGTGLLGLCLILALVLIVALALGAAGWVSEHLLPVFSRLSVICLAVLVFVMLPLSIVRRCRSFTSVSMLLISYVFGATVWMEGLLLTLALWGTGAVVLGLLFMGIGVVPIAMLATLFHGMWARLLELSVLIVLTFACRFAAIWVGDLNESLT